MKRLLSVLLNVIIVCGCIVCFHHDEVTAATTSQQNIVGWADYYYGITWTAQKSIAGWHGNSSYNFSGGNTYRIPYAQPVSRGAYIGYGVSVDEFLRAASDINSVFYTNTSAYKNYYSTYYGMDCSSFVSSCWGISRKTTESIPGVSEEIGAVNSSNVNKIQIGDALNSKSAAHVVLVTDVIYSGNTVTSVEITEQTPPELKRTTYSASSLVSYYGARGYKIHRYNGTVPTPPNNVTKHWYEDLEPIDLGTDFYAKITTNNHRDVCNSSGNVNLYESCDESNHVWYFIRQSDGSYKIKNAYGDNSYMDVYGAQDANVNVQVWAENYSDGQYWYIYSSDNNSYYLRPKCSDRVLDVYGGNNNIGDNVGIWSFNGTDAQRFNISKVPYHYTTIGDSFYAKIVALQGDLELATVNGNVEIRTKKESPNHIWQFVKQEDNTYKIINMDNGVLDAEGNIDSIVNVQTWVNNGNDNQRWYVYKTDGESYYFKPKCADKVLDVSEANFSDGANVGIYMYNGQINQQFRIEKTLYPYEDIGTDFYAKIITNKNNDVIANGGNVEVGNSSLENNHIWFFKRNLDGSYKIKNFLGESSYMDVEESKDENANVIIWFDNDGTNQDWYIYETEDNDYFIKTKSSNRFLDVIGGNDQVGDNVGVWTLLQSTAQTFSIEKLPPFNAKISLNKGEYLEGESIVIKASADGVVDYYEVQIWRGTELVFSKEFTSHEITLPAEMLGIGEYGCYVSCVNSFGNSVTDTITFNVLSKQEETEPTVTMVTEPVETTSIAPKETTEIISTTITISKESESTETVITDPIETKNTEPTETTDTDPIETTSSEPTESKPVETTVTEPNESEATSIATTMATDNATEPTEPSTGGETEPTDTSTPDETESTEPSTPDETKPSKPTEDKGILGDVNGDGKVNVKDATLIQKAAAKITKLTDDENMRADVNGDSKVNVKDATVIQKYVAKLETGFLVGEPIVLKKDN